MSVYRPMTARKSMIDRVDAVSIPLAVILRVALGGYFIYAGVNKVAAGPGVFLKAVHLYDMLPEAPAIFLNLTAVALPWLEIVCGAALVLGLMRRGSAAVIAAMLCVFSPAIFLRALVVMKEENVASFFDVAFDCGCGTGAETIWIKLLQNLGLLVLALYILVSRTERFSLSAIFDRRNP